MRINQHLLHAYTPFGIDLNTMLDPINPMAGSLKHHLIDNRLTDDKYQLMGYLGEAMHKNLDIRILNENMVIAMSINTLLHEWEHKAPVRSRIPYADMVFFMMSNDRRERLYDILETSQSLSDDAVKMISSYQVRMWLSLENGGYFISKLAEYGVDYHEDDISSLKEAVHDTYLNNSELPGNMQRIDQMIDRHELPVHAFAAMMRWAEIGWAVNDVLVHPHLEIIDSEEDLMTNAYMENDRFHYIDFNDIDVDVLMHAKEYPMDFIVEEVKSMQAASPLSYSGQAS
jgi:hypothetical protein